MKCLSYEMSAYEMSLHHNQYHGLNKLMSHICTWQEQPNPAGSNNLVLLHWKYDLTLRISKKSMRNVFTIHTIHSYVILEFNSGKGESCLVQKLLRWYTVFKIIFKHVHDPVVSSPKTGHFCFILSLLYTYIKFSPVGTPVKNDEHSL